MKNHKNALLFIVVLLTILSCKKNDAPPSNAINLTAADAGKTVAVINGQAFTLTLGNPGDGGFDFNVPQCDTAILRLNKHTHTPPSNSKLYGDFGQDTFEFIPSKTGISTLKVTASRGKLDTVVIFSGTINVQ